MNTPLRKVRKSANLTLMQVASRIGCDPGNLSRMERGLQKPAADFAEKLSRFYGGVITEIEILYPERFIQNELCKSSE